MSRERQSRIEKLRLKAKVLFFEKGNRQALLENLDHIHKKFGLIVDLGKKTKRDEHIASLMPLNQQESVEATASLREELEKYPPEYIRDLRIKRLRLAKSLKQKSPEGDEDIAGLSVASIVYVAMGDDKTFFRKTIHHELFHRRDKRRVGSSIIGGLKTVVFDASWRRYNESEVSYSRSNHDPSSNPGQDADGFAHVFGLKSEEEDRATVAEELMTEPVELMERAKADKTLAKKIKRVMALYKKSSKGKMNEGYFQALVEEQR